MLCQELGCIPDLVARGADANITADSGATKPECPKRRGGWKRLAGQPSIKQAIEVLLEHIPLQASYSSSAPTKPGLNTVRSMHSSFS
jgi:hypothetical protein